MIKVGKDFTISGVHANKVAKLVKKHDMNGINVSLFSRNLDVLIIAPLIGLFYNKKSQKSDDIKKGDVDKITINYTQLSQEEDRINYIIKLILLLGDDLNISDDSRVKYVFENLIYDESELKEDLFRSYLYGGIDILYDNLINNSSDIIDSFHNLYSFVDKYKEDSNMDDNSYIKDVLSEDDLISFLED